MPRRRRVNLRKITPERDGEQFARRHAACPWKVEWREPATRKVKRRFLADEHRARRIQRKIEDTINTYNADIVAHDVRLEFARDEFLRRPMSDASRTEYARSINTYGRLTLWQASDAWTVKLIDLFIRRRGRVSADAFRRN